MIYFAYGSNLDRLQMSARCPRARFIGSARLHDYRLTFPRRSQVRDSAVASVERSEGESVWGALYEVADEDVSRLDGREGYEPRRSDGDNFANRVPVTVIPADGGPIEAMTYVTNPKPDPGLPSADYLSILITGAIACSAAEEYIAMLASHLSEARA
jgi:gamma-glutamylcyclotransferase (GGCT)/AIG2-like uncharacterized protein YtfP